MWRGRFRNWRSLGAVTAIAIIVGWLLYLIWRSPSRDDLATYGAFALPVVALVAGWYVWAWRKGKAAGAADELGSEELDRTADQLAIAVQAQWERAASERGLTEVDPIRVTWSRPSVPMTGPLTAAVGSERFNPLPGLAAAGAAALTSGQIGDLHAVYGGLRSGRLIIAGPPGSGKSGTAVLLLLAALRHRKEVPAEERSRVPVPVMVTAQDWDPENQPVADWLTRKLQNTYPLLISSAGAAITAALLAADRITVILDGLDEIIPDLRPIALQALSRQATFRVILLSRTSEMAAAVSSRTLLQGAAAVELRSVAPADAASYLERVQLDPPSAGWRELTQRVRALPDSPLSQALSNPLTLSLIRDTYQSGDGIGEFLDFCDAQQGGMPDNLNVQAITDYLLDRILPAAYTRLPGQPPLLYDLPTARHALGIIAVQMNQEGTRDLNWWLIPTWAPSRPRALVSGLVPGLVFGLVFGLAGGLAFQPEVGLGAGLGVGFLFGIACGGNGIGGDQPQVIGNLRFRKALTWNTVVYGLRVAPFLGLMSGLLGGLTGGLTAGLVSGLVGALVGVLGGGLIATIDTVIAADPSSNSSLNPTTSWRSDRAYAIATGLVGGLATWLIFGLIWGLPVGLNHGLRDGLVAGLAGGLIFALAVGFATAANWAVSLASAQLAITRRTPVSLMKFLDDAHGRNVLRVVGPSYQFRHARLQDRLAAMSVTNGGDAPAEASQLAAPDAADPDAADSAGQESAVSISPGIDPESPSPSPVPRQ